MEELIFKIWAVGIFIIIIPLIFLNKYQLMKKNNSYSFMRLLNPLAHIDMSEMQFNRKEKAYILASIIFLVIWFIVPFIFFKMN